MSNGCDLVATKKSMLSQPYDPSVYESDLRIVFP